MVVVALLVTMSACTRPADANGPSPSATTSPVAQVSTEPSSTPSAEASAIATSTPVQVALLRITSAVFHPGEVGIGYAPVTLAAVGGLAPLTWSISVGALPGGLTVSGESVSGTPTAAGTYGFTVRVDDTAGHSATVNRSIAISPYLALTGSCNSPQCNVEVGCITVCGNYAALSGGVGPFRFAFANGTSAPPGMTLNGLGLNGPFPPEPVGALPIPWSFQVLVTDSLGANATVAAVFHVVNHLSFLVSSAACTPTLTPYTCTTSQLQYTGGVPGTAPGWKVIQVLNAAGAPEPAPKGFTITFKAPSVIVAVPSQGVNYYGVMTLVLTDPSLCAPSTACPSTGTATITIRV